MTKTVDLDVAQATLSELVAGLTTDDELIILKDQKPIAKLVLTTQPRRPRKAGNCQGMITILADDDEHLCLADPSSSTGH